MPVNPWNTERWAGASSSGSGAATAAGLCFESLGSDTGGSIRFPAAANGTVRLKPTYGRVSRAGVFPLAETFDHVGPLARSSTDAALMLQAIPERDSADPTSLGAVGGDLIGTISESIAGLRIGFDEASATDGVDAQTTEALRGVLAVVAEAGAEIVPIEMPRIDDGLWMTMVACEAAYAHAGYFPERADGYGGFLAAFLALGSQVTGTDNVAGLIERAKFSGRLPSVFDIVDVIVSPVMARAAFPAARDVLRGSFEQVMGLAADVTTQYTALYNFSGATLTYAVRFNGPAGQFPPTGPTNRLQMKVGGVVIATNGADPWLSWSFSPAFYGESTHESSDTPGTVGTKARLYSLMIQSVDDGAYRLIPCYLLLDVQYVRYHAVGNSCTDISIWTA